MKPKTVLVGIAALGALAAAWWAWSKGKVFVTQTLNPASDKNAAYSAVNAIGAAVSGNENFSLGGAVFDLTHAADSGLDLDQAAKTCAALYPPGGAKRSKAGSICHQLGYGL